LLRPRAAADALALTAHHARWALISAAPRDTTALTRCCYFSPDMLMPLLMPCKI